MENLSKSKGGFTLLTYAAPNNIAPSLNRSKWQL